MKKVFAILILSLSVSLCYSQGGGFDDGDLDEVGTPLDESAGMFAGAIGIMGAYVLYKKRKNKQN